MIGETEGELASAGSLREEEHQNFIAIEKEMLDTVESLNGATAELKNSAGSVQITGGARQGLDTILTSFGQR